MIKWGSIDTNRRVVLKKVLYWAVQDVYRIFWSIFEERGFLLSEFLCKFLARRKL